MKLSTKILMGGMALLMASTMFIGCPEVVDENEMISFSGSKATINYFNDNSGGFSRGFKTFKTKHEGALCKITFEDAKTVGTKNGNGVMGFCFDMTKNDDGSYNFGAAGTRVNKAGELEGYVSYFKKVNPDTLSSGQSFLNMEGKKCEDSIWPTDGSLSNLKSGIMGSDGNAVCVINVVANDDGSYKVSFYDSSVIATDGSLKDGSTALKEVTVSNSITGLTKKRQADLAVYANVYANCTLKGSWDFTDIYGNAIPVEVAE